MPFAHRTLLKRGHCPLYSSALPARGRWRYCCLQLPICGRPAIVLVRIASGVVRIQVARRTISVVAVAAETNTHMHLSLLSTCLPDFRGLGPYAGLVPGRQGFSYKSKNTKIFRRKRPCRPLPYDCVVAALGRATWADPQEYWVGMPAERFACK